ncbi:MAG: tetratricopeptide repeat protein [Bacteroidia bacterium]|nr:tetratricopeptide repeat protein [Bacteroidia bacterium]
MRIGFLLILSVILIALVPVSAQNIVQVDEASELMKNGKYQEAIEMYQLVIESGQTSPELHYNLGVAYHSQQKLGYALWHFLLAKKMGMGSAALEHNISLSREGRVDEIEIIEPFFLMRWWNNWRGMLGANTWAILSILLIISGAFGLSLWRLHTERKKRKSGFIYGVLCLTLAVISALTSISTTRQYIHPEKAILLVKNIELRSAPDKESSAIMNIHEGIEVRQLDQIGEWVKVRLQNGQTGWILKSNLGYI